MRIAVTGAQGFVGKATVRALLDAGHEVLPIVRTSNGTFANACEWNISYAVKTTYRDVEAVVHIAAKVDDWATYEDSSQVNVLGTQHVIDAFPEAKTFIYISSASVYDSTNAEQTLTEVSLAGTDLLNAYSQTKYEGERVVLQSPIPSRIVLRPHIIYGPGDTTVLPRLLQAQKFGRFLILGNGKNHISLTHIHNLSHAIVQLVDSNRVFGGEVFNIVDDRGGTVNEIIAALKSELGITAKNLYIPKSVALFMGIVLEKLFRLFRSSRAPLITRYLVEQMTADHTLSTAKATERFGYKPAVDYLTGFKRL
jgi:nucleoside-diphosphate-sugar epimerase